MPRAHILKRRLWQPSRAVLRQCAGVLLLKGTTKDGGPARSAESVMLSAWGMGHRREELMRQRRRCSWAAVLLRRPSRLAVERTAEARSWCRRCADG
jgi:hypothetical protein